MSPPRRPLLGLVFAILTLIWGTTWAAIRIGLRSVPPLTGVAVRFALAATLLLVIARLRGLTFGTTARERRLWLVVAAFSFCSSYGVVYWSEQWVPSGLAAVIFATMPLFVGAFAHLVLPSERLNLRGLTGLLVGFGGVGCIFSTDFAALGGPPVRHAALVLLVSPLASSIGSISVKRWGGGIHPLSLAAAPMAMTASFMGLLALLTERGLPLRFDGVAFGSIAYLAVCGTAVTFTLYYWMLSFVPVTTLALISYTVPVVAVLIGTLALHEPFTSRTLVGSVFVLLGVSMAATASSPAPQNRLTSS